MRKPELSWPVLATIVANPCALFVASLITASYTVACGPEPDEPPNQGPPGGTLHVDPNDIDGSAPDGGGAVVDASLPDVGKPDATTKCSGSATPCSLLASSQCATALGCHMDGSCGGFSASCYNQISMYSCMDLEGCYWLSSSKKCQGSSWSCSMFSSSVSCVGQDGCHWDDECDGTPLDCDLLTVELCDSQPGCFLTMGGT